MITENNKRIIELIKQSMSKTTTYNHLQDLLDIAKAVFDEDNSEIRYCLNITKFIKTKASKLLKETQDMRFDDIFWKTLHFEAPYLFESYLYYMEKDRLPHKRFYKPRERTLKVVVDDLQDLEDRIIDFYGLSLPPRTGKSTICIFFLSWIMGKRPDSHNAMSGHSGILAEGFYDEAFKITTSPEYHFSDVFPNAVLESKSAEKREINLGETDRFATLTCRGIDGTWTGAIDISADGYLYVDDLVRDRTESLSPMRLEGRYQDYLNVLVDRKNDGSRELMVGTRWNVIDPLGRIKKENKDNPRYRFREIPALNDNGESNFQYDYKGFSTEYFLAIKARLDKNEWEAKYQQRPFKREGLLFPEDELIFYNGVLPPGDMLIRKAAACDVAWGGGDSLSMPFGDEYTDGYIYVKDWIFNKGDKVVTTPIVVGKIMSNKPNQAHFEANNGGDMYADAVEKELIRNGHRVNISYSKAPSRVSKLAKIIQYAPDVKRKYKFLKPDLQCEEYRDAMDELTTFAQIGDNDHDDAADGITQLEMLLGGGAMGTATAGEASDRIW